jgi:hypothetical protein
MSSDIDRWTAPGNELVRARIADLPSIVEQLSTLEFPGRGAYGSKPMKPANPSVPPR